MDTKLKRSIVFSNVPESSSSTASANTVHDTAGVRQLFDFLDVEYIPTAAYHMCRSAQDRLRLIKVLCSLRAGFKYGGLGEPLAYGFPSQKGVFLRPSLTREERNRRREERLTNMRKSSGSARSFSVRAESQSEPPFLDHTNATLSSKPNSFSGNC